MVSKTTEKGQPPSNKNLKLAMDVHAASMAAARMMDGAKPPPQAFKAAGFLAWVQQQQSQAKGVAGNRFLTLRPTFCTLHG